MQDKFQLGLIEDLKKFANSEQITGSILETQLFLYGSRCGQCDKCNSPCLHPLSTHDLQYFFRNYYLKLVDWIDDKRCVIRFSSKEVLQNVLKEYFQPIYQVSASSVQWYISNKPVIKELLTDTYGEKGKFVYVFCRMAYSNDRQSKKGKYMKKNKGNKMNQKQSEGVQKKKMSSHKNIIRASTSQSLKLIGQQLLTQDGRSAFSFDMFNQSAPSQMNIESNENSSQLKESTLHTEFEKMSI